MWPQFFSFKYLFGEATVIFVFFLPTFSNTFFNKLFFLSLSLFKYYLFSRLFPSFLSLSLWPQFYIFEYLFGEATALQIFCLRESGGA